MGAQHGVLVVVPVPASEAWPGDVDAAIARAVTDAEEQRIRGKAVTPFLLKRVSELSGGASQRANQALLVHNARTAGQIARELTTDLFAGSVAGPGAGIG
jgi:pseudouridine-5'-phosphate glycosidase